MEKFYQDLIRYGTILENTEWENKKGAWRMTKWEIEGDICVVTILNGKILDIS